MAMMNAAAVTGKNEVRVIGMEKPIPQKNEVLIRIRICALCTWEQRVYAGENKTPYPTVGGHEIAGEIAALGEGVDEREYPIGARVSARVIGCCHKCYYCRRGQENLCVKTGGLRLNGPDVYGLGGLAEYIALDSSAVWLYPDRTPFEQIALTEPVACVVNSLDKGAPRLGDDVVVIGGGVMGMLHLLCSRLAGARVILSEPDAARRAFAQSLGCRDVIDPAGVDAVEAVLKLTEGRGAEVVYDTTALPAIAAQAVRMTGKLGRCVIYSSQHPDAPISISPNWLHSAEPVLTGAVSPSISSFDRAVNLIRKGLVDVTPLISGVYELENAEEAFRAAVRSDTYRILIRM